MGRDHDLDAGSVVDCCRTEAGGLVIDLGPFRHLRRPLSMTSHPRTRKGVGGSSPPLSKVAGLRQLLRASMSLQVSLPHEEISCKLYAELPER